MEFLIILIVAFIVIIMISGTSEKGTKEKSDAEKVSEILNREYKQQEEKVERLTAERDAIAEQLETLKSENKNFSDDIMLITKSHFEEMCQLMKETCDMIMDICRESDFLKYVLGIKEGNDNIDNSQKMYGSLKFFIIQDILRSYGRLGNRYYTSGPGRKKLCSIEYDTAEGQLLFSIVMQMMQLDGNKQFTWDECKEDVNRKDQYSREIRLTAIEALNTYANADVKATASNGLDDFAFCIILHNYNKAYENAYRKKMLRIATVIANVDGKITTIENEWLDSIMNPYGNDDASDEGTIVENPEEELNSLIGLGAVKNEINTLCNFIIMKKKREEEGLKAPNISYHCVFTGNPGTGKTTVARLLAAIYKDLGVLKKGHLVETDRSGLVAEYVGQTAVKTNKIIDSALDGVLFIDEAYTLANGGTNDYGPEAIATLLKRMEDNRERLVVILAGYTNEIEFFINSNPGLRSRFNRYIHFEDYSADELYEIFCLQVKRSEYTLSEEASQYLKERLAAVVTDKSKDFGNARYVRNLFENAIETQANRLAGISKLSKKELTVITKSDLCALDSGFERTKDVTLNHESYLEAKGKTERLQAKNEASKLQETASVINHSEKPISEEEKKMSLEELLMKASSYSDKNDDDESIEVSYSILGYDDVGETTFNVDVKERDYDWLTNKDEDGEYLDSDFISENRRGLHKRILRAIRENMEDELEIDDLDLVDDDDIEYTVTIL